MKITRTDIPGILIIEPDVFKDDRGYFFESFSKNRYKEIGLPEEFVQDNISKSKIGTVRGLHYQVGEKAQGKLCQVIEGEALDVAVDIRFNSPTFGKYFSLILDSEKKLQLWIPQGFAHGFSVLSEEAIFSYKCTNYYSKPDERTIIFNDQDLNIDWKVEQPIVSEKDLRAKNFKAIEKDFIYEKSNTTK
ncbi:MAG: dTDP-4-dehydrorhamnose 3,5-epimerase [Ignavibacteriota bacterium]|nr:MAG: dTDP-4-dehydrorhamnose 3,5-epimerase [Chlorobiota bacterium]MBE7475487.1 dTDP-4-dehydrorhamnose 3,5-epimerase [Ignavibacteriales bacterium]MBL1122454.1 dTDP-4-dehydrorhamnose 3,5-epimerase [Ignavibacteriota bacterium]MCC7093625.1 dTDP-4-dehydrorhamnose 3,5-epimerase [Ignavibacteriaceae bacterium]MCE7856029.1 dTDP-4-dehydrorhamnose 3,5-epimerase [Ignavibacteria bacterium CHB3]MEB2296867.1 dTDP-4-dehydrorhamnose 3,5-epimerase [Ignavibacteria bacterium]